MTAGFYKYEDENLQYTPNSVMNYEFCITIDLKDTYTYPVFGWYYFNSEEEAKTFFNIVDENIV